MSLVDALSQFSTCKTMWAPPASALVLPLTLHDSGPGSSEHHDITMPSLHQKEAGTVDMPWTPWTGSQPLAALP